jgi:alpha-galactosidase
MITVLSVLMLGAMQNLLNNPGFENGLDAWKHSGAAEVTFEAVKEQDHPAARIIVPDAVKPGWPLLYQEFPAQPGQVVRAEADALSRNIHDGVGAYMVIEFQQADGKRLGFEQSGMAPKDGKWPALRVDAVAPPETVTCRIALLVNGHGEGVFTKVSAVMNEGMPLRPLDGPVTLTVTDKVVCDKFIGIGAEDDGWFYNKENAEHGVEEADYAIREGRIDFMHPHWVRMFFWYKDFNPSGDWETFDFDSDNMRSHYRTLDQYQRLGARVNVVGVEWGVKHPYADPDKAARGIGALMEHLIRDKGYTCVQEWTLTNEPNGYFIGQGGTHESFRELHQKVKAEFARRGLNVRIVGSDDTGDFNFFSRCVNDDAYFGLADYLASHRYLQAASRPLMSMFLDERLDLLQSRTPRKPLVIAEFGFQDARSGAMENPIMETYPYAIWTSAFVIEGLNKGVAGFSIWCLHEMYYPGGGIMNYGLWNHKKDNYRARPVYHAWAMFSRFTHGGDAVRRCDSSNPAYVSGAYAGGTLFWVNQSDKATDVIINGITPKRMCVMKEDNLKGDRECGDVAELKDGRFTAPPVSFGYARPEL